jgi:hypothetical protein
VLVPLMGSLCWCRGSRLQSVVVLVPAQGDAEGVVGKNPPTGVDRQHESQEAQSLYPSALQLAHDLMLRFIGRAT